MIQFEIKAPIGREYDGNEYTIKCMDPGVTFAVELFTVEPISPWRERAIPYQIPDGSTATLRVTRPDRAYTNTKTTIEGGIIFCPVHPYSVATPGKCSADVAVYGPDGNRITSATFHFFVDRECAPTAGENAPVFVDSIQGLIEFVEQSAERAEAAADRAESSGGGNGGNPPKDGITPHIGENGNWHIGTTDTGVSAEGEDGEDGGHYTPVVTQPTTDTIRITFTPSKATMPAVAPVTVQLPAPSESNGAGEHPDNPVVDGITVGGENGVRFDSEGEPSTPVLALYGAQGDEPVRVSHVAPAQEDGEAVPLGQVKQLVKEHSGQNVELDITLSQSGKAADAGAVGAALGELAAKIPEGGNTGDPAGTAASMVGAHNASVEAHPDIRETLDALAEVAGVDVRPQPVTVTLDTVGKNAGAMALDGSVTAGGSHSDLIPTGGRRRFALNVRLDLIFYAADESAIMRKTFGETEFGETEFEIGFNCAYIRVNGAKDWMFGAKYSITMSAGTSATAENLYNADTGLVGGMIDGSVAPTGKHISKFLGTYHPSIWTLLFPNVGAGTYTLVTNSVTTLPYHITLDAAGYITGQGGVVTKGKLSETAEKKLLELSVAETDAAYIGIRIGANQYSNDIMIYKGPAEAYPGHYVAAVEPGEANPVLTAANLRADFANYTSGALVSCEDTERQTARLATALNSAQFIRENREYKIQLTDYFSHEGNIQIDPNGIAYVVHTSNEVSSYDGSNDTNLKIEMAVVDLEAGEIVSRHVVAKHQDIVGGAAITSGLGAPNIVLLDSGIVRMIFSAQLDGNPYCSMYRDYDPATGELGAIGKCMLSVDGATYDLAVDTISEHVAPATKTDSCVHHNSQWARHTDGYYYLFVTVSSYIKPGVIMRTQDFITFEPWLVPQLPGDDIAQYEAQVMIKDKYMFLAMRIGDLSKMLIVQIDMTQKTVVATQHAPDCNARSWWMFDGYGMPYLIHSMDSRGRTDIIKLNYQPNPRIILGGVVCQGYGHVYPSVAKYGTYYYMASRISDRVCVTRFRLPWRTSGTVEAALLRLSDLMEI